MQAVKTTRIEKGYYRGEFNGYGFRIIYNDDLEGELLWSIHYEDDNFGELIFSENDQLWFTKSEAVYMAVEFIGQYANHYEINY